MEITTATEISHPRHVRPHLVILGAGASRGAFPSGEAHGRRLPLMDDFTDIVPVGPILARAGRPWKGFNFEQVYGSLGSTDLVAELESAVRLYFESLELPTHATLYDELILSLRGKDVIATFNWDPFLIQAYRRNSCVTTSLPRLLFLHGNVLSAYCVRDRVAGVKGARCSTCGRPLVPSRLLYPTSQKNYAQDPAIAAGWQELRQHMADALFVTIFGYGAPPSDVEAVQLMSEAWGHWRSRQLEQIEFIDVKPGPTLLQEWERFVYFGHHEVHSHFRDSWLARHPRRSVEAFQNQYLDAALIHDHRIPEGTNLDELQSWFRPLAEAERQAGMRSASVGGSSTGGTAKMTRDGRKPAAVRWILALALLRLVLYVAVVAMAVTFVSPWDSETVEDFRRGWVRAQGYTLEGYGYEQAGEVAGVGLLSALFAALLLLFVKLRRLSGLRLVAALDVLVSLAQPLSLLLTVPTLALAFRKTTEAYCQSRASTGQPGAA